MKINIDYYSETVAKIQVWGKGYKVTSDSEEFQRLVPFRLAADSEFSRRLREMDWGSILNGLYGLAAQELGRQRCLLVGPSSVLALCFSANEDQLGRPSLVLVTTEIPVHWTSSSIGLDISKASHLASRLAQTFGRSLGQNRKDIAEQLRTDSFVNSTDYVLGDGAMDVDFDWSEIVEETKRWRGILGVCTPQLVNFGANVVIGTQFEAEQTSGRFSIDGYFNSRDRKLTPIGNKLSLWSESAIIGSPILKDTSEDVPSSVEVQLLRAILGALERLEMRNENGWSEVRTLLKEFLKSKGR